MSFKDKVVLVTGGSRGIGRAIVTEFVENDATVIINYNSSEEKALALKEELLAKNKAGKIYTVKANVSDPDRVKELFAHIKEEIGQLDILVNNAGLTRDKFLVLMNDTNWNDVIQTNLNSVYYCSKAALNLLAKNKRGTIINMSSTSALHPNAGQTNYAATKAAIIAFTKALAKEVAKSGITVNAIAPGFIETEMTSLTNEKIKAAWMDSIPMKRFGAPEEIAKTALFLASDGARYITGQHSVVDGGLTS